MSRLKTGVVDKIVGFWLITDYSCNNRCWWCYAKTQEFQSQLMPLNYAKGIIKLMSEFKPYQGIIIGGEPTLYPHLEEILRLFNEKDISPAIITNGRRYSDINFLKRLLAASEFGTNISFQTHIEAEQDRMTGRKGSFAEAVKGISNCLEMGITTSIQTTLSRQNLSTCIETVSFLQDLEVKNLVIGFALPPFEKKPDFSDIISISEIPTIIASIYNEVKDWDINVSFNQEIPLCMYGDILEEMLESGSINTGCHVNDGDMIVWEPAGTISPCTHFSNISLVENLMDQAGYLIPDTKDKFLKVWNKQELVNFREERFSYVSPNCQSCKYWGLCTGGCPINWFHYDPESLVAEAINKGGESCKR